MFPATTYIQRRKHLMDQVESGIILFLGNEESSMNYKDNTYHFRQDSSFLYFFGLDFANLAAIIDVDQGTETIFGNELTMDDIVWMGTQPTLREKAEGVGIKSTSPMENLKTLLQKAQIKQKKIHFLPPYRPENILKLNDMLNIPPSGTARMASVELIQAVVDQRNIKSPEEIDEIEKAVNISADMHLASMKMARPGMYEYEIAAEIQRVAQTANAQLAFPIILTVNGQTLHNHYHGNRLEEGMMLLNDSGAETDKHYAGDLSHTFPVGEKFTQKQKEIYLIALNAHQAAVEALKPGVKFREIHLTACKNIAQGMKDMGFMKGDMDEAVSLGAHALFFQCGTGHMMGLDVHDMEDLGEKYVGYLGEEKSTQFGLKSLRLARALEPGFVVTIEPGIYFIPELIDMWHNEKKFDQFINYDKVLSYKEFGGLRSEEDFLITPDGHRMLGKPVPKTIEEIEAIRS